MYASKRVMDSLKVFYAFTRPFANSGAVCMILSTSLISVTSLSDISLPFIIGVLQVVAALYFMLTYGGGINQLFDVEIDKINKPYLPLASGKMSIQTGIIITCCISLAAFAIGISSGSIPVLWGVFLTFVWGSTYSVNLPFLRWKRSTIATAFLMLTHTGIILPLSTYLHMQVHTLGRQANFPRSLAFATIFFGLFGIISALFKDLPDIEGDKKFGFHTLAAILGPSKVFWACVYLLEIGYTIAIIFGVISSYAWSKLIIVLSHAVLSFILWKQAKCIDLENKSAIATFYLFLWKLLKTECLLIPLVR